MNTTLELMKKNVVMLDENSDELENIADSLEWLVRRESTSSFDKAEIGGNVKKLRAINDVIIHLIGDDLVHILENDTEYYDANIKIGLNGDIKRMCDDYKEWLKEVDLSKLKKVKKDENKQTTIGLSPEVCFKLGELIGTMSRLSTSLKNMDAKDSATLKDMIILELAILEKTAMNIAQELFHSNK